MEKTLLYDGAIELVFDEAKHLYFVNGQVVPGVTTPLDKHLPKPWLAPWAAKMCAEYLEANLKPGETLDEIQLKRLAKDMKMSWRRKGEDAADIGTLVHKFAEDHALGKNPTLPINKQARNGAEAYLAWLQENHVEVIFAERRVYSRDFEYAGTVDLVARINGALEVVDYKSSNAFREDFAYQTAAYQQALREELGWDFERRRCLRFDKETGLFETKPYEDFHNDWRIFRRCLALFKALKEKAA